MATAFRLHSDVVARDERRPVRLWGRVTLADGRIADVVVTDVSASGFLFERLNGLTAGTAVSVDVGGLPAMVGEVVRNADGGHGCRLDRPLDDATIERLGRDGPFAAWPPAGAPAVRDDENEAKWPIWARASAVIGSSAACWAGLLLGVRALLG